MFSGHADLPWTAAGAQPGAQDHVQIPYTLGFTSPDGQVVMSPPEEVVSMISAHSLSAKGKLETVFINGCKSEPFGRALHAAGIPYVICWKTLAEDAAARIAITTFFTSAAAGAS